MSHHDAARPQSAAASANEALSALRREIDSLDDAMLSLVERRVAAARGIAELKRNDSDGRLRLRPAREAAVVERLAGQAHEAPRRLVRQIWQEIMACCLDLQHPSELHFHASRQPALLADAMRRRFGCAAQLTVEGSPGEALEAARSREAVAVLEVGDDSAWWAGLAEDPVLEMFDVLRTEDGKPIGVAVGRIAGEDLGACPEIRVVAEPKPGDELLATSGSSHLIVSANSHGYSGIIADASGKEIG